MILVSGDSTTNMPTYSYKCTKCTCTTDLEYKAGQAPESVEVHCKTGDVNNNCVWVRDWSFGIGRVNGAGETPGRSS